MTPDEIQNFKDWGQPLPTREAHGTDDDIRTHMVKAAPTNWRQEGNRLIADTELGELVQFIPTDMILTGVDENNRPVLAKVKQ